MDGNTPLPDHEKDRATHSLELSAAKYEEYMSSEYFTSTRVKTAAEIKTFKAEKAAQEIVSQKEQLKRSCFEYQYWTGKCDSNFYGMLMAIKADGNIKAKAGACLLWLDKLWTIYSDHKENDLYNQDFSEAGVMPYSFDDVRKEAEG